MQILTGILCVYRSLMCFVENILLRKDNSDVILENILHNNSHEIVCLEYVARLKGVPIRRATNFSVVPIVIKRPLIAQIYHFWFIQRCFSYDFTFKWPWIGKSSQ